MVKRIVSLAISVALLITCFVLYSQNQGEVIAGAGNGTNTRVETVEDLASVLELISGRSDTAYSGSSVELMSSDISAPGIDDGTYSDDQDEEGSDTEVKRHTSATVHISTQLKSSSSSSNSKYTNGLSGSSQNMTRELTLYITDDATYYVSEGISRTKVKRYNEETSQYSETSVYMKWDMELAACDGVSYAKFHEFIMRQDGYSMQIKEANKGQWISLYNSGDIFGLIDVDYENREVLSGIGDMLDTMIRLDYVSPGEDRITMNEDDINALAEEDEGSKLYDEYTTVDFTVDMSSATSPYLCIAHKINQDEDKEVIIDYDYSSNPFNPTPIYSTYHLVNKVTLLQEITIKNIDNTIVKSPEDKVDIAIDSYKDFESLFLIEEKETEDE